MQQRGQVDKPYQLVRFPAGELEREKPSGQDRIRTEGAQGEELFSGQLKLTLLTLSPLQVATGITDFVSLKGGGERLALTQLSVKRFSAEEPQEVQKPAVIPGSSLKGAVRSMVEAVSPSCVSVVGSLARRTLPRQVTRCADIDRLCPACRLFGMTGGRNASYMGRISFNDAAIPGGQLAIVGTPILWTPARGGRRGTLPPRYLRDGKAIGHKLYEHRRLAKGVDERVVVKANVAIPVELQLTNLSAAELGLLFAALGRHPQYPFPIKIGAGKPVGMGSVEVRAEEALLVHRKDSIEGTGRLGKALQKAKALEGESLANAILKWIEEAQDKGLIAIDRLSEVSKAMDRANLSKPAPEKNY